MTNTKMFTSKYSARSSYSNYKGSRYTKSKDTDLHIKFRNGSIVRSYLSEDAIKQSLDKAYSHHTKISTHG